MESIGEKLKTSREAKALSIDQIARDTNIAKRYILALEHEDFEIFPGEPYLLGFLRNYSDYLGLDANEMIALYRFQDTGTACPHGAAHEEQWLVCFFKNVLVAVPVLVIIVAALILAYHL